MHGKVIRTNFHNRKIRKNIRGISPIIAEILLIGLTILAGAITFGTVIVAMTSKPPLVVSIDSFSDFTLTNSTNSTRYNSFSFVLDNQGKRDVGVNAADFKLFNTTDGSSSLLQNWTLSQNYQLNSLQSYFITATSISNNESTWLTFNSTIKVELTAYALDQAYNVADRSVVQASTSIDANLISAGPLTIETNNTLSSSINYVALNAMDPANNSLQINVFNYGHLPVNYTLDFIISNSSVSITNEYVTSNVNLGSTVNGYLPAADGNKPSSTSSITPNQTIISSVFSPTYGHFIIIWLKIGTSIQDTLIISC